MKCKMFLNNGFFAALYNNPTLGGLCVVMFRRSDFVCVADRFVGSVCGAVEFLRGYSFVPVSEPSQLVPDTLKSFCSTL